MRGASAAGAYQLLARLEGQVMLAALASRVRSIELTAEPQRGFNNTLRSLATLPVRVTAN
jgi:cytochrome P450